MTNKVVYIPGDEWLYYRIYGGHYTMDKLLKEKLFPLINGCLNNGMIDKWFFVRYNDPDHHIRLRLKIEKESALSTIMLNIRESLTSAVDEGLIWKIELGTYQPEYQRYGTNCMEFAESLFFQDSHHYCSFNNNRPQHDEDISWLYALLSANDLLDGFGLSLPDKKDLMLDLSRSFGKEFGKGKALASQLSDKFRKHRKRISELICGNAPASADQYLLRHISEISGSRRQPIQRILRLYEKGETEVSLKDLLSSLIHMLMNRAFVNNNRVIEMVVYDFMHRYYRSAIYRKPAASMESELTTSEHL